MLLFGMKTAAAKAVATTAGKFNGEDIPAGAEGSAKLANMAKTLTKGTSVTFGDGNVYEWGTPQADTAYSKLVVKAENPQFTDADVNDVYNSLNTAKTALPASKSFIPFKKPDAAPSMTAH